MKRNEYELNFLLKNELKYIRYCGVALIFIFNIDIADVNNLC